jgi:hypothetical protein
MVDEVKSWWRTLSPLATAVIAVLVYAAGILVWGTRIDSRVVNVEARLAVIEARLAVLAESDQNLNNQVIVVNERQQGVLRTLESNARRLEVISSTVNDTNSLLRNHDDRFNSKQRFVPDYPPPLK